MPGDRTTESSRQDLAAFQAQQEEMLNLSREYSRSRLAAWNGEVQQMQESWAAFSREWQSSWEEMSGLAQAGFADLAARGEATGNLLSQSLRKALGEISGDLEDWVDNFLKNLEKVGQSWLGLFGGSGGGDGWLSWLGGGLGFGGLLHQGGIVAAHQGLTVSPGAWGSDEQLILAQSGEGILPRDSMGRLGEQNFEALRTGRFELTQPSGGPRLDLTIQVQSLDAAGVNRVDWDRLVQRHILPLLQKEADRRW
ncbi:MAG: hypothetical protein PHU44_06690 [Syntrophales bacterium]|nr:hypothetical protein [Syntrophales bacterium]MDD5641529.1 hypothetical protein [Syntrophales bacterium]